MSRDTSKDRKRQKPTAPLPPGKAQKPDPQPSKGGGGHSSGIACGY